jgi:predicted transcriptional regulator
MVEQTKDNILQRLLSSDVKADLLVLFHKNPGLIDTMDGIARRIGRLASAVEAEIRDLVAMGLLKVKIIGGNQVYSLDKVRDKTILDEAAGHIRSIN